MFLLFNASIFGLLLVLLDTLASANAVYNSFNNLLVLIYVLYTKVRVIRKRLIADRRRLAKLVNYFAFVLDLGFTAIAGLNEFH